MAEHLHDVSKSEKFEESSNSHRYNVMEDENKNQNENNEENQSNKNKSNLPGLQDLQEDLQEDIDMMNDLQINTLKEPVTVTINREFKQIGNKLRYVLIPQFSFLGTKEDEKTKRLRQWDLWGPIMLSMTLSLTLSFSTSTTDGATLFLAVFLTIVLGASIVTFNAKLLGGKTSLLQTIGVLGYCLFPICISTLLIAVLGSLMVFWGKMVICTLSFLWSSLSSLSFMRHLVPSDRQVLGIYPVLLFYIFISWFALTI